jgi:hypothetical protein
MLQHRLLKNSRNEDEINMDIATDYDVWKTDESARFSGVHVYRSASSIKINMVKGLLLIIKAV